MASGNNALVDHRGHPLRMDNAHTGASVTDRALRNWQPFAGSADSDLLPDWDMLSRRGRDLGRNNGVAAGAVQSTTDNVVGTGLRLAAKPEWRLLGWDKDYADDWARHVESLWRTFSESPYFDVASRLDFHRATQLIFRQCMINGDALALPLWFPSRGGQFATMFQLVEADRLCNPQHSPDTARLRGGIERDRYGAPVAYHIRRVHPGDDLQWLGSARQAQWDRIPARTRWGRRRVIHVYDQDRIGQSRGKSWFTSILPRFRQADEYELAELKAAVVNSMIAAFIETPLDGEGVASLFGGDYDSYIAERSQWEVKLRSGSVVPLYPGDKLNSFNPGRPNSEFGDFLENIYRHIGVALGLPYELLMKDFSKTNYSSARAALLEAWRTFAVRRAWLASTWAQPVYELWFEEAANSGLIEAPDFYENRAAYCRARWIGAGRGWIDPVKEAEAAQHRMDIGLSTLEDECAEQGRDWEDVLEQRAREQAKAAELGVVLGAKAEVQDFSELLADENDDGAGVEVAEANDETR